MTRKRGKSRTSSGIKRSRRFKAKWSLNPLTKRPKRLLPTMVYNLEPELVKLDFLEVMTFVEYDLLGIPEAQQPYYTAFVKRSAEIGLTLSGSSRYEEQRLLREEFEERGLDPSILRMLQQDVDTYVNHIRGELSPVLINLCKAHSPLNVEPTIEVSLEVS